MTNAPETDDGEDQQAVTGAILAVTRSFEGPLPPPNILAGYEDVLPGSAERILLMAEQESAARRVLVASLVSADVSRARWGLWLGAFVAIVAIVAATVMALAGHAWPGTVVITIDLASVVSVFVYGTWFRARELRDEASDLSDDRSP